MLDREFPECELNVEGYPDRAFLALVAEVRADQVTLVPDDPDQATSDHGWDFAADQDHLASIVAQLKINGHRVALFADADATQMPDAVATGADRVELYTGPYGSSYNDPDRQKSEISRIKDAAAAAIQNGMGVNAGHDLTVAGTTALLSRVPSIAEVSIGHALFCDALTFGMAETVKRYAAACKG
jgi:pyridoxine 5-phosphate synthase